MRIRFRRARLSPRPRPGTAPVSQSRTVRTDSDRAAGTSLMSRCVPSRTTSLPPATTWRTSAAVAAKITDSSAVAGDVPASRGLSSATVTRSASAPGTISPASGHGSGAGQLGGGEVAAPLGGQPLAELDPPGLLEQVDHGLAVGAEAEHAAGRRQRAGRPDPVGEVGLRRRAEARAGPAAAKQLDVPAGQVGSVH